MVIHYSANPGVRDKLSVAAQETDIFARSDYRETDIRKENFTISNQYSVQN